VTEICPECEGHGSIEEDEISGGVNENGPYMYIDLKESLCLECNGTGRVLTQDEHDQLFYDRIKRLNVLEMLEKPPDSKLH